MPLLGILTTNNKVELSLRLSEFKERGVVRYDKVLSVPTQERIPALTKTTEGRQKVTVALAASIESAMSNINLKVGLSNDQIVALADHIIDQSYEDNLSIEDVLLFLGGFLTGKYGKLYDRFDIILFFEFFEKYRQERYEQLIRIREEQNINFKAMGAGQGKRMERDPNVDPETFFDLMQTVNEERYANRD